MDIKNILPVLAEQKEEVEHMQPSNWCSRKEESLFEMQSNLAQVVIGVRRSGKSTLCHKVLLQSGVSYGYANFDDDRLINMQTEDLDKMLNCIYQLYGPDIHFLFFDEIQNVEGWHLFVNRLLRTGIKVFVTGSNAKLLSSELATHLTGRYNEIRLYPFSFAEYSVSQGVDLDGFTTKADAAKRVALNSYLLNGGFPELPNIRNKQAYVQSLIEAIITRDIKQRFRIRHVEELRLIAQHIINNVCQEIKYEDITKMLNIGSITTTRKYVEYLSEAFLIHKLSKFSFKSRERLRNCKAYIVDTGLIANRKDALLPENIGWRLENCVCIELLRRTAPLFRDVYYYKPTSRSKEVDFVVCEQGNVVELLQVAYDITSQKSYNREIDSLIQASIKLKCSKLTLIAFTETRDVMVQDKLIHIVDVIDWLK